MSMKRIGIFGNYTSPDAQELKAKIEDRGGEARIIDLDVYPMITKASIGLTEVVYDGMNLLDFDAFYARRVGSMWSLPEVRFTREEWIEQYERFNDYMANLRAILTFRFSLVKILCDRKLVVNPFDTWGYHQLKPHQYWVLKENGFRVPEFISGNDFFELKKFLERGEVIDKPLITGPVRMATVSGLEAGRENLRDRPIMYQTFIRGKSVRAFVLGDDLIVACELPHKVDGVDASERIEHMQRIELPRKMQQEIVRAAKTLGMIFSGVDLQYDESSGDFYVLECNSSPFFRPYDAQVGADIGGKLADYLLERS